MKIVLDANVVISSLISNGLSHQVVDLCIDDHEVFTSRILNAEVLRFFIKKTKTTADEKSRIVKFLDELGPEIVPKGKPPTVCRDKNDNHVLHLAESFGARAIISGDQDLLVLRKHNRTHILSPRQFLEALNAGKIGGENFA